MLNSRDHHIENHVTTYISYFISSLNLNLIYARSRKTVCVPEYRTTLISSRDSNIIPLCVFLLTSVQTRWLASCDLFLFLSLPPSIFLFCSSIMGRESSEYQPLAPSVEEANVDLDLQYPRRARTLRRWLWALGIVCLIQSIVILAQWISASSASKECLEPRLLYCALLCDTCVRSPRFLITRYE